MPPLLPFGIGGFLKNKIWMEMDWDGNMILEVEPVNFITGRKEDDTFFNNHNKYGGHYGTKHSTPYEIPMCIPSMLKYSNGNKRRMLGLF